MNKKDLINFEEEIASLFNQGKIRAPVHLYHGNEDKIIEIFKKINKQDWVFCSWRSHYQCLLKGVPEKKLTKEKIHSINDMILSAKNLVKMGAKNVLLKGGHLKGKMIIDILANSKEIKIFKNKKILTKNLHGTGCSLSSAIATYYSCGKTLKKSCELAINYVNHAITNSPNYGKGNGPINHLTSIKIDKKYL